MADQIRSSFKLESAGTLTAAAGKDRWNAPFSGQILGTNLVVGTAPTGAALIVDILKNGTSIYTTATKPQLAVSTTSSAVFPPDADPAGRFVAGDVFSLSITQIGSTVAGADLDVNVEYIAT